MGIAHHSHHVVWCEDARTAFLRESGISYRELEERGVLLVVVDVSIRYRAPAHYDDVLRVDCWVRDRHHRRIIFGYAIVREADRRCLATAQTSLIALDSNHALGVVPAEILAQLVPVADPVRL